MEKAKVSDVQNTKVQTSKAVWSAPQITMLNANVVTMSGCDPLTENNNNAGTASG